MDFSIVLSLAWVFFDRLGNDVKEGQVIMGCYVLDDISRAVSFKVSWLSNEIFKDGVDITLATCDKGRLTFVWITRFEVVTDVI
ncbi:Uncharacterised protein [Streptococcus pneumoniae]|nr:Uncharacterised protein [Streptococcus pneumoniae]CIV80407.1 Uncharacterised protein [Streptococcus pneumoniae]CIV94905.1 Uncharacterised protein [Streptococcus pneumoniae]CRF29804.1 Uncharacterised protein [Streptococcus pneumoniae]